MLFDLDPQPIEETLTAPGGMPLVAPAFRSLGLPQSVKEHGPVKERERGYDEATFVESFVILNAAGGECVDNFKRLREDPGLAGMFGHELPSPRAALQFLYAFHEEERIAEAKQQRLPEPIADIPEETPPLEGLALPAELLTARPQRLRFLIFNTPGRLAHHARCLLRRLAALAQRIAAYREALRRRPLPT